MISLTKETEKLLECRAASEEMFMKMFDLYVASGKDDDTVMGLLCPLFERLNRRIEEDIMKSMMGNLAMQVSRTDRPTNIYV